MAGVFIKSISILSLLLLSFAPLWAQTKKFKNLTVNSGLSHSDVRSVCADENGLIWLATNSGLNRYDGYELSVFKHDFSNPNSLINNRTKKVRSNGAGKLFLISESNEVFLYDVPADQFRMVYRLDGRAVPVVELFQGGSNEFYVRSVAHEIYQLIEAPNGIFLSVVDQLPDTWEIQQTRALGNTLLMLTTQGQVLRHPMGSQEIEPVEALLGQVHGMSNDSEGYIFACADQGIFRIMEEGVKMELPFDFSSFGQVTDVVQDKVGGIWVAFYAGGVAYFQKNESGTYEEPVFYTEDRKLNTNRINDLLLDGFNELWIATSGAGVYHTHLSSKPFYEINKQNGFDLADNYITAIHEQGEDLLVGTRRGMSVVKKYHAGDHREETVLANRHITCFMQLPDGRLLIGTRRHGLFVQEGSQINPVQAVESDEISGLTVDHFDRVWVSSFDQGVFLLQADKQGFVLSDKLLPTANITYLFADRINEKMYLGTIESGLIEVVTLNDETVEVFHHTHVPDDSTSISSEYTWPMVQSADGRLWVGTIGGGLNVMTHPSPGVVAFEYYTVQDGLPDNDIESILVDDEGYLWLAGRGLSKFDPIQGAVLNNFNYKDGLQSNSFKIGAAHKGNGGRLFFGGINGLNYFQPTEIRQDTIPAQLMFDRLSILNHQVGVGQQVNDRVILPVSLNQMDALVFEAEENEFTISMLAVHHGNPEKNKYAYKLEGYNEEWVEVSSTNRHITFANLKEGQYTLHAKASNGDGLWSAVRKLYVTILPPWYLTWWALILYGAILFLLLLSYRYLIFKQTDLKKHLTDSEIENQKNEDRLKLFTNISHEIRTPLTLIKGPLEDIINKESIDSSSQSDLLVVHKNVDRLLRLTNQILEFRRYESGKVNLQAAEGNIVRFVKEVCALFRNEAQRKGIELNFESVSDDIKLTFDRDKFEIVLANLMSNAHKFTQQGGEIRVDVRTVGNQHQAAVYESGQLKDNFLQISVSDTGAGMSSEELQKVFDRFYQVRALNQLEIQGTGIGLALVKNIVQQHKGEISVKSKEGHGSTFVIKMPFGTTHLTADQLIEEFHDSENLNAYMNLQENDGDTENAPAANRPDLHKPLILVVEDNPEVAAYIQKCLRGRFRTKHAKNGEIGLKLAEELLPDLIVSDVMMPKMDGIEMLLKIRANSNCSFIPVILLTARTSTLYEVQGIDSGAQDYITKPFNPRLLIGKINSILDIRSKYKNYYLQGLQQDAALVELPGAEYQFLENLRRIVLENLTNEDFSVSELTRQVGMSQSAFYKRIKELTGRSAVQFIRDVRLSRAAELILQDELSIGQVAFAVGINDAKYFREKFKALFGVNPSDYKAHKAGL
ncbi:hybrid sensor histidine kinase/response regulator transcription factor [Marinoscillum furvescens]|uniref:histidine kinase n=1 Tax=Marinoscillum furvescens DSM 4134 TaxID=1122208 RepID=A0A3D9L8R4_MARFU|nr:ATP-binding protein [Marinoscillum furvescens]REE02230.1 phospho-acceptor domain-containing protein [Marinoscillum furvescens DSM 4134]